MSVNGREGRRRSRSWEPHDIPSVTLRMRSFAQQSIRHGDERFSTAPEKIITGTGDVHRHLFRGSLAAMTTHVRESSSRFMTRQSTAQIHYTCRHSARPLAVNGSFVTTQ